MCTYFSTMRILIATRSTVRSPCFVYHVIEGVADEVDPYAKPQDLLEVSPKGLVPAMRFAGDPPRSLHESTVIMEYLEEYVGGRMSFPFSSRSLAGQRCSVQG